MKKKGFGGVDYATMKQTGVREFIANGFVYASFLAHSQNDRIHLVTDSLFIINL